MCGFEQDNTTDQFDWTRIQGRTPSANTGPEADHMCGVSNDKWSAVKYLHQI
ncbi:hypothetical protein DPMN_163391 [Dreissena polymorpha]|uniref:MAM domain-containing protein n=1 Tax=Dreissena polymorpha TaxID=45954 RepID=A0A9D4EVP0_DREPO|nr:hypothetical protein DPMN_163391 [Dreissena polymorpha]